MFPLLLKIIWLLLSVFLIFIIYLRVPRNQGLTSFATKSDLLGSPNSTEKFLNNFTLIAIISYYLIAVKLNQMSVVI
nr:Preprotein translocase SecG subunit [Odontella aurita var. minima]